MIFSSTTNRKRSTSVILGTVCLREELTSPRLSWPLCSNHSSLRTTRPTLSPDLSCMPMLTFSNWTMKSVLSIKNSCRGSLSVLESVLPSLTSRSSSSSLSTPTRSLNLLMRETACSTSTLSKLSCSQLSSPLVNSSLKNTIEVKSTLSWTATSSTSRGWRKLFHLR